MSKISAPFAQKIYAHKGVSSLVSTVRETDCESGSTGFAVNGNRKLISSRQGGFHPRSQRFLDAGGCVVVVSSCEEGAGGACAVGQASAAHGAAWKGMEHPGRCS